MELEIIAVYDKLEGYIAEVEKNPAQIDALWYRYAIEPYWDRIAQYAPFDMSDRKPEPVKNIHMLKQQLKEMKKLNLNDMKVKFMEVMQSLPNYDEDPIVIAIYPVDDDNNTVKERQNGVLGSCIFGNILLHMNPLAEDYQDWIPYVFAHEYHHCVWGNYWNVVHGGRTGSLLESMLIDGQADAFAKNHCPNLKPLWLEQITNEHELWEKHYSGSLLETEYDYSKYMFGSMESQIPWCAGYHFGYGIVADFMKRYPDVDFIGMLETDSEAIYSLSNYRP